MAIGGTYGFVYCGAMGLGIGVFTVADDRFEGSDFAGGRYSGTAKDNPDGTIALDIEFEVPAGRVLVQGTYAQDLPHRRRINTVFPSAFGDGKPVEVPSPPGTVTVMVKRIPDDFAPAATTGVTFELARGFARSTL
jgi:hypothetical protein